MTAISSRIDQYDYWFDGPAHAGQNALLLVDAAGDAESYKTAFASLTKVGEVLASRFGQPLKTYQLYFAEHYVAR